MAAPSATPRPTWRFRFLAQLATTLLFRVLRWRLDTRGTEHVPGEGGFVLVWNHHANVDVVPVAMALYHEHDRSVRFLGKQVLWESPATRWAARFADAVPVDRSSGAGRAAAYDAAVAALRAGHVVGVAPEGTISDSFELLPFRLGAVRMAQQAGVPVLPCVSWGSHRAFPRGRRPQPRFGQPVLVAYAEPLEVPPDAPVAEANERLRDVMQDMLHELQAAYPVTPEPGDDWWQPARLGGSAPDHEQVVEALHERAEEEWGDAPPARDR